MAAVKYYQLKGGGMLTPNEYLAAFNTAKSNNEKLPVVVAKFIIKPKK